MCVGGTRVVTRNTVTLDLSRPYMYVRAMRRAGLV